MNALEAHPQTLSTHTCYNLKGLKGLPQVRVLYQGDQKQGRGSEVLPQAEPPLLGPPVLLEGLRPLAELQQRFRL